MIRRRQGTKGTRRLRDFGAADEKDSPRSRSMGSVESTMMSVQRQLQMAVGPQGWTIVGAGLAVTAVWIVLIYI
jgi:hypothetical protein